VNGLASFSAAALVLLIAPGPTNALLAAAGARLGVMRSVSMLAVVLAAYAVSVGFIVTVLAPHIETSPNARLAVQFAAAIYLTWLGLRLWRTAADGGDGPEAPVSAAEIFLATLLNPKGLVIGLVLLPAGAMPELAPNLVILALAILGCGLAWILAGSGFARAAPRLATHRMVNRASGAAMLAFAGVFVVSVGAALLSPAAP
jgi:threonine/homoserine/homoserine lactone efflux protein